MKTFKQFQEAALAIPAAAGVVSKVLPAAAATIGAVGTFMQARKKGKRKLSAAEKKLFDKSQRDTDQRDDVIRSNPREIDKQNKLVDKYSKKYKTPKQKTDTQKLLRDLARGEVIQDEIDFVQYVKDRFKEKGLSGFIKPKKVEKKKKTIGDLLKILNTNTNTNTNEEMMVAPTNNVGGGKIAGTVEAGDDPPVKKNKRGSGMKNRKKKKYAYGGRGSRKMWMA